MKAEDIGAVVMADRVEVAAGGQDVAEVQVGDKGFLALPHRPGEDLTAGRHDDRVAFFEPVAVLLAVLIRDELVPMREARRDLVGVQDRVDADHETSGFRARYGAWWQSTRRPAPKWAPATDPLPARTCGTWPAACSSPSRSGPRPGRTRYPRPAASSHPPSPTRSARHRSGPVCGDARPGRRPGRSTAACCRWSRRGVPAHRRR